MLFRSLELAAVRALLLVHVGDGRRALEHVADARVARELEALLAVEDGPTGAAQLLDRQAGGTTLAETEACLRSVMETGLVGSFDLMEHNPGNDPSGRTTQRVVALMSRVLARRQAKAGGNCHPNRLRPTQSHDAEFADSGA